MGPSPHTQGTLKSPLQLSLVPSTQAEPWLGAQLFHGLRIRARGAGWTGRFQQPFQTSIWAYAWDSPWPKSKMCKAGCLLVSFPPASPVGSFMPEQPKFINND